MTDKPEAVRMMLVPEHPTYEQLAKMSGPWCCTVEEMAESWAELLDNIEATPSQDASALVEAVRQSQKVFAEYAELHRAKLSGTMDSFQHRDIMVKVERNRDMSDMCLAALTAWEAQHG